MERRALRDTFEAMCVTGDIFLLFLHLAMIPHIFFLTGSMLDLEFHDQI